MCWKLKIGWQLKYQPVFRHNANRGVMWCQPFQQLPDFPDVYWFEGKTLGHQARDLDAVFAWQQCLLDALLGAPNYNINNFLIIKSNNIINKT